MAGRLGFHFRRMLASAGQRSSGRESLAAPGAPRRATGPQRLQPRPPPWAVAERGGGAQSVGRLFSAHEHHAQGSPPQLAPLLGPVPGPPLQPELRSRGQQESRAPEVAAKPRLTTTRGTHSNAEARSQKKPVPEYRPRRTTPRQARSICSMPPSGGSTLGRTEQRRHRCGSLAACLLQGRIRVHRLRQLQRQSPPQPQRGAQRKGGRETRPQQRRAARTLHARAVPGKDPLVRGEGGAAALPHWRQGQSPVAGGSKVALPQRQG